ncbi:hybrid sensor histidine kinase/response regulator transcription factor [Pseudobacter ginsenosidimutans]|uniref:hybrid sensor histidine kinase/response regulator transcription factor n=1 Tax=Pseudobacter ginsenosidimutans TaxID=661488 RepID=UPI00131538D1|nr:two-component regulator propeller domain-containing protein [Pseudobacter ginsenosidimutans]
MLYCILPVLYSFSQPKCRIDHYSTEDGLSHDIITYMYKDREGFMWFGTWNGINRFDGHRFVSFKSAPGDLSHLKNDRIDQIAEDDFHHFWMKAYDGQIYRFDKKTERFLPLSSILHIPVNTTETYKGILSTANGRVWIETYSKGLLLVTNPEKDSSDYFVYNSQAQEGFRLPGDKINFFREDKNGMIWVGTPKGLACLAKDENGIFKNYNTGIPEGSLNITCIAEGKDLVAVGASDGQVFIYHQKEKKITALKLSNARLHALMVDQTNSNLYATSAAGELIITGLQSQRSAAFQYDQPGGLHTFYEDRSGNLWIKPQNHGVVKFCTRTRQFKTFTQKNNAVYNHSGDHFKVYEDNKGVVWVNMKGGGFGYYDPSKDQIEYFNNEPNSSKRLFSNIVHSLFYDAEGLLWLRTDERGIEKITFQRNQFNQHLLANPGVFQSDNEVRGLCRDRKNRLWVGVKSNQLYVLQNGVKQNIRFLNQPAGGLGSAYTIMQDRKGNIWLGTKANGLFLASPQNTEETVYRLTHFQSDPKDQNSISNEIYSLLEDEAGRIWIGTFDNGLYLYDPVTGSFVHNRLALKDYPVDHFKKIRHMAQDHQGHLWLATTEGLLVVDPNTQGVFRYAAYQKIPGDLSSLGNNNVQFILKDSKNNMWLATSGGGLNKAEGSDPLKALQFTIYTSENGLPNDYILSAVEDRQQFLWVATQAGFARFDPVRKIFRNYNSYDGVPKYAFSESSVTSLQDGELVFGTIRGYLNFDPAAIKDHPMKAEMAFTNLQINNTDVKPGASDGILSASVNHTPSLELKYNQNIISIDYVVLDYRAGSKQSYAYRLAGFDKDWHYNMSDRRATYTNLPPGDYVFEVKCMTRELYNNVPVKSMRITILPPPWKTWWAYTLYAIAALLLFLFARRTALTMLRLRHKIALEKKIAAMKMNFFTNVSHELRTPVTLIVNPIEEIYKHEALSERGKQYMEVVRKNANRMGRFVNQLLDLRKIESGKAKLGLSKVEMVSFVKGISAYFTEQAREKQIDFKVEHADQEIYTWIDADKIETVVYNLVSNAFKFTPNGRSITVAVKTGNDGHSIVEVADQGAGVPPDKLSKIFELFYEGDAAGQHAAKGTGIGLALCRQMVALHGGSITAWNNPRGGLTVKVELLPGKDHFKGEHVSFVDTANDAIPALTGFAASPATISDQGNKQSDNSLPLLLLVEDNADLRFFLQAQLQDNYRIASAENGEEGYLRAQALLPDLILSDVMMPKADGMQMLGNLKANLSTSHIPVVLLTAKSAVESQIEGMSSGADYYITKPFHHDFLLAVIDNLIRQRKKILSAILEGQKALKSIPGELKLTAQDETFLQNVAVIVEEKMTDADFDIDTVAEAINMGRTTFYKKFKSLTGLAPVEFVSEMRLKKAQQLLNSGYGNITEVAYAVGFSNAKYFSTCFRTKFGVSPSEYLKQNKSERMQNRSE